MRESKRPHAVGLSRRLVVGAGASLPMTISVPPRSVDPVAHACQDWLTKHLAVGRLMERWRAVESWLVEQHRWFQLTEPERCALPQASALVELDRALDELVGERDAVLRKLPALATVEPSAIVLKLEVVAALMEIADHVEACALVRSAIDDVREL